MMRICSIDSFNLRLGRYSEKRVEQMLGGGFKYVLFSPLPGEMIQFDNFFSDGLKPPTRMSLITSCLERRYVENKSFKRTAACCHKSFCTLTSKVEGGRRFFHSFNSDRLIHSIIGFLRVPGVFHRGGGVPGEP